MFSICGNDNYTLRIGNGLRAISLKSVAVDVLIKDNQECFGAVISSLSEKYGFINFIPHTRSFWQLSRRIISVAISFLIDRICHMQKWIIIIVFDNISKEECFLRLYSLVRMSVSLGDVLIDGSNSRAIFFDCGEDSIFIFEVFLCI